MPDSFPRATGVLEHLQVLPSRGLVVFLVLFLAFLCVFTIAFSWFSWLSIKERESVYLSSITELGGKSIDEYFSGYEKGLGLLRLHIMEKGHTLELDHTTELLKQYSQAHEEIGSVFISQPDGEYLATWNKYTGQIPAESMASYQLSVEALNTGKEFVIGRPVFEEIINDWGIPMHYAIRDFSGKLVYVLSASLHISRQQTIWQNIFLPENAGMGLLTDDLYMLSRYPVPKGEKLLKMYTVPRSGVVANHIKKNKFPQRGKGEGFNSVTGYESLFSFHRLKQYPITLFVNIPLDGVKKKWLNQTQSFFILVAVFFICALVTAYIIHKRRAAIEEERKFSDELIKESEERFNLAMEGSNDGLWDWNLETDEVYYSPRWKSMLGYSEEDIEHNLDAGFNCVHPDDKNRVMTQVDNYLQGKSKEFEIEMRMKQKQGGWVCILSRAFMVRRDIDNKPVRLIGTHIDITARYRTDLRERLRNEVLEQVSKGEALSRILRNIVEAINMESAGIMCVIYLVDAEGKHLVTGASLNLPEDFIDAMNGVEIGIGMGSCSAAAYTGKRIVVEDIDTHPYWSSHKSIASQAHLRASWAEPVLSPAGKVLGAVAVYQHEPCNANEGDIFILGLLGMLASTVIEQGHATEELQQAALVYKNSHEAMAVTDASGIIISVNPAFTELTGYKQDEVIGKTHRILKSGHHDDLFYEEFYRVLNSTGQWQGEFWNRKKDGGIYIEWVTITAIYNADGTLHRHVSLSSDITEKKESEELVWKHANFDTLTGLPNRRMFRDHLEWEIKKVKRSDLSLALLFLDLDRFKEINDSMGHEMGDELLKEAAKRISACVRKIDMVARLGGDEFTVILSEIKDPVHVERVSQEILEHLAEPFQIADGMVHVSASIGITYYPKDATLVDDLLRNADHAMYAAKNQGRNRSCYFTATMQEAASYRSQLMSDLRGALEKSQFKIYYQPITDLTTGMIDKAEALLRWQHPTRGIIQPSEFIHLAEETGLINSIGDWVFHEVANQSLKWRDKFGVNIQVSINKSPIQFQYKDNAGEAWIKYLKKFDISGKNIAVEITEGLLLDASEDVSSQLLAFRDAGIQVSLDDFGTGYSSLAYLKKFDIDYLKIDKAFVSNLAPDSDDLVLCEAITVMAHKLGMKVIAEGVETKDQLKLLIRAGSDYAQGYLFSKPVPLHEFERKYIVDR